MTCPCGSGAPHERCCGPWLDGAAAPTAEALMRSRYSAHVLGRIDYLMATWDAPDADAAAVEKWARESEWLGLEIVSAAESTVEFRARYRDKAGVEHVHHERSRFRRREGRWVYVDGAAVPAARAAAPGRNDPCPCGSGKKYKKCHGG
jgi:SEC-C motif-containing protein